MTGKTVCRVEDLKLWQRAMEFSRAINAIIDRQGLVRDRKLREQLLDASDSVVSNIAEGFEQSTDRSFAKYLYISKASAAEARTRLKLALDRQHITEEHFATCNSLGEEVARMATGLIKHLMKSDRRARGLGQARRSSTDD
jgi:four helix bundle protein